MGKKDSKRADNWDDEDARKLLYTFIEVRDLPGANVMKNSLKNEKISVALKENYGLVRDKEEVNNKIRNLRAKYNSLSQVHSKSGKIHSGIFCKIIFVSINYINYIMTHDLAKRQKYIFLLFS